MALGFIITVHRAIIFENERKGDKTIGHGNSSILLLCYILISVSTNNEIACLRQRDAVVLYGRLKRVNTTIVKVIRR